MVIRLINLNQTGKLTSGPVELSKEASLNLFTYERYSELQSVKFQNLKSFFWLV